MDEGSEGFLDANALRARAERLFQAHPPGPNPDPSVMAPAEVRLLLHELQVRQIELEIQNDELGLSQDRLHASTARYFDLYDHAPVGYCTLSPGGEILESNLTADRMLGAPLGSLVGHPITRFLLGEDQETYASHRQQFTSSPGPHSCELRMVKGDGVEFWVQLTATDVADAGRPTLSRVVLSDITGLKRVEEDKTTLATQLHHARKLETLGVLAAGLSHDFNALLNLILSSASAGSLAARGAGPISHYFRTIEGAAIRATELTHQLLAYAGKAKWRLEDVDLDGVAKDLGQTLATCLPSHLTFRKDLADRLPYWRGDSTQAYQILLNLAMNAFESFPEGVAGQITLRTRGEAIDSSTGGSGIWVLPVDPGRYVVLEVEDSGRGMTPDQVYHAFEPFYTTKATGRGLGLAAVHGILNSHGGGLWVRSSPGQGTSIKVCLPATAQPRDAGQGDGLSAWRGEGTLLVIDFEARGRSRARALAERCGFTVLEARGGLEAVELFQQQHAGLALVLLDLGLQGTSARETYDRLRGIDGRVPVVFTANHEGKPRGPASGEQEETLGKPYRPAEFQGTLQRTLARRAGFR